MSGFLPATPTLDPLLWYDPPYERPLEDEFAWHMVKYLDPVSNLEYQVEVETPVGKAWIDFVVTQGGKRYGFEISGLDEEETQETRYRDALVIGSGAVDVLYRLRGKDLLHYVHLTLAIIGKWDEHLFSPRGRRNIETLAGPDASDVLLEQTGTVARGYTHPSVDAHAEIVVRRLSRPNPDGWLATYDEALVHYGVTQ